MKVLLALVVVCSIAKAADVLKEEKIDLDGDSKPDLIRWLKEDADDETPSQVIVIVGGKTVLDYKAQLCRPDNGYRNPDECEALNISARKSSKNEPIIALRTENTQSSVDQTSSTYLYRRQNDEFTLIGATFESHSTAMSSVPESSQTDINYSTSQAIVADWIEKDEKVSSKKSKTCSLKNPRKKEKLSAFSSFLIVDEVKCQSALKR